MPFSYKINCTNHCGRLAEYKVASRWTDGVTEELKTYGLLCEHCLPGVFLAGFEKQENCRLTPGETLDPPGIYQLNQAQRDMQLVRLDELESQIQARGADQEP